MHILDKLSRDLESQYVRMIFLKYSIASVHVPSHKGLHRRRDNRPSEVSQSLNFNAATSIYTELFDFSQGSRVWQPGASQKCASLDRAAIKN